jgi:RNA polymerase sigma factor for flagellar operon FliA
LIEQHLPLVRHVARRLAYLVARHAVVDADDLVSYGIEGLIAAVDSFDPGRGARFSTWAVLHIRTTIIDALRALDPVSQLQRQRRTALEQARLTLAQAQGRFPTEATVAAAVGLTVAQVRRCEQQTSRVSVSLEAVHPDEAGEGGCAWQDALADADPAVDPAAVVDRAALRQLLRAAVATLPERERLLITAVYHEGVALRVVAARLGVSEVRVSQLRTRALRRLRDALAITLDRAAPGPPAA